jgi:hypothetical protein
VQQQRGLLPPRLAARRRKAAAGQLLGMPAGVLQLTRHLLPAALQLLLLLSAAASVII